MAHASGEGAGGPASTRRAPGGPAKGDRRRQAIVGAVEQLLQERSIAELSVEDIAVAAGISRSGFYFYFESKYAALGEALTDVAEAMTGASQSFFRGSEEAPEAYVRDALGGVAALWREHVALMCAIVEAAHSDSGARAIWDVWRTSFVDAIAARIEAEQAAGRAPHSGLAPRDHARTLLEMNLAVLYEDGRRRVPEDEAQRTVDALAHMWLTSVWGLPAHAASS